MTLITRSLVPSVVLGVLLGGTGVASAATPIDPLTQHTEFYTRTPAQTEDSTLYGRWTYDKPLPTIKIRGANAEGATSTFEADSPVPGLARSHGHSYCVTQHYAAATLNPAAATLTYTTKVVVRRHHKIVARHTSQGTYTSTGVPTGTKAGPTRVVHDRVSLPKFTFRSTDTVRWTISGKLANQVKKFRTKAIIAPHC